MKRTLEGRRKTNGSCNVPQAIGGKKSKLYAQKPDKKLGDVDGLNGKKRKVESDQCIRAA